ncbi:MAG: hypothetical protein CR974_00415 [Gammaproteobacteria bacterium]|nr:MAG: hypothetical protein CR974_00415 [Gammaproteobacteria bacterium]
MTTQELIKQVLQLPKPERQAVVEAVTKESESDYILLSTEEYRQLKGEPKTLLEALSMQGLSDIDFDPQPIDFKSQQVNF